MIKDIKIDMNPARQNMVQMSELLYLLLLVKPVGEGLGGDLSFQENVSNYWNTDGGLNLNYRKKDNDFFLSTTYNTFSDAHSYRKDE